MSDSTSARRLSGATAVTWARYLLAVGGTGVVRLSRRAGWVLYPRAGSMRRLVSLAAVSSLVAILLAPAVGAAPRELWPGVTYESGVQFTTHGPVAINVLRGPRPGGLTTLEPVLSN